MPTPTTRGNADIQWGTDNIYTGTILSASKRPTADKAVLKDNQGNDRTEWYFNQAVEWDLEAALPIAAPTLVPGDLVTLGGVAGFIVQPSPEFQYRQDNHGIYRFTARKPAGY